MRTSCILLIVLALVAQNSDIAMATKAVAYGGSFTPQDCRTLPAVPGPCAPSSCLRNCQKSIGFGSVGECVPGGCQCTYCIQSKRK
ncbi:unnamed protein product [Urochloa decumbens]|uniref:Uncharacterized protein n=1 Tax=Urochloa decumbens TaxID=240449 RepID=A0ABC9FJV1_9POAL